MAASYRFCKILQFSKQDNYYRPLQLTIEGTEEEAECKFSKSNQDHLIVSTKELRDEFQTLASNNDFYEIPNEITFIPYDGYIDLVVNQVGKVYQKSFTRFLRPNEFSIYYLKELDYFIFADTQKDVVSEFIESVNFDQNSGLKIEPIEVNFDTLQPLIPVITGVWFGDMNKQYLKSAGYFGRNVDKSSHFNDALNDNAKISSLLFDYTYDLNNYTISVTKSGSVVLYTRIRDRRTKKTDISSELKLVTQIFLNYILPGLINASA